MAIANNSAINAISFVKGNSGNITLQSPQGPVTLQNSRVSTEAGLPGAISPSFKLGNGGNINIIGRSFSVIDGAQVTSISYDGGKSGNIQVNAPEFVEISGGNLSPNSINRHSSTQVSALQTTSEATAAGSGGDINLTTNRLNVSNGAKIESDTHSMFNGGNITVNAPIVDLSEGGQIFTTTFSKGNAGNITLNDAKQVSVSGNSGLFANTSDTSTGNGGNLKITTGQLFISNGSQVSVSSAGSKDAGSLTVDANFIKLDTQGKLVGTTASGNGGNITLQNLNLLLLRNNSQISTRADNNGNGGNVTINAPNGLIVAIPEENSDILANADQGSGGQITITAAGIYGLENRSQQPLDPKISEINASSEFGRGGIVQLNTPEVDPSRGLVALPTVIENTPKLVSSSCAAFRDSGGSSFTVTGRGGSPPSPDEPLSSDVIWSDTRLPMTTVQQHQHKIHVAKPKLQPIAIIPATGWVFNDKGEVTLISKATNATVNIPTSCATQ